MRRARQTRSRRALIGRMRHRQGAAPEPAEPLPEGYQSMPMGELVERLLKDQRRDDD